ncbi:MAG: PLP-dependent transferase [Candidatus Pacebacteria bacterium]|nr:PLP-dependent transferase [Candidatus Paceibacterota bacterium]MBP9818891.1 PLP-dependent transferase [Candidatus Paceibacterota bacterium]
MTHFDTKAVHAGEKPDPQTGAVAPIVVRSKTFKQKQFRVEAEYQYGRGKNPTRAALEEKLAQLEGVADAGVTVFSSGNSAVTSFLLTLKPGDHIILGKEVYGGTYRILDTVFKKFGLLCDFVDFNNEKQVRSAITPNTKYLFVESVSNPSLHVVDLSSLKGISIDTNIPIVIDGTFLPPNAIQYFEYGAETIIYSLSKYFAGHNDVIGGAVVTRNKELHEKLKGLQRAVGAVLSPDEAYRVLQGVKTLGLRWDRVCDTALKVAHFLESHTKIRRVIYPLLESHPDHEISKRQLLNGAGAVVSFELYSNDLLSVEKFVNKLTENDVVLYAESLASPQTILAYPAWMSHRAIPAEDRVALGISDSFFRLSVGFEDVGDIVREFENALGEV